MAWNTNGFGPRKILLAVLSRDVFEDGSGNLAAAGFELGFAHRKLGVKTVNETPLGTVIAAPAPGTPRIILPERIEMARQNPGEENCYAPLKEIESQRNGFWRAQT